MLYIWEEMVPASYFFKRLHVLKYGCRRRSADQGCPGYYRYTSGSNFYHWCDPGTDHFIYCNEPGQFPYRPRYHAIRDNRIAAESIGINITKYKLMAFSISAGLAGVAGVLYAHNLTTLTALPKNFGYNMSIMILVYVVLGGIGSIRGSVIATVILYLLPEMLRGLSNYRMLMYASC